MMRIGSLFSGAGGLDMAVEQVFGGTTAWHSEIDRAASKVLAHRWPGVPNLGDITKANWNAVEPVDVLCGGFPCQDVSTAGRQAGMADGTRSGLWAEMARIIGLLSPTWVVIENVKGLLSAQAHRNVESDYPVVGDGSDRPVLRAIGAVLGDLSELGYDAAWATVSAASVGAAHRRERVFVVANADGFSGTRQRRAGQPGTDGHADPGRPTHQSVELFHTPSARDGKGLPQHPMLTSLVTYVYKLVGRELNGIHTQKPTEPVNHLLPTPAAADGQRGQDFARAGRDGSGGDDLVTAAVKAAQTSWGKYEPAIRRWEQLTDTSAPPPTELNGNGNPRLSAQFSEWLMGWPSGWVTDPGLGLSRGDQLRIVGNGVCPQQAHAAISRLLVTACGVAS